MKSHVLSEWGGINFASFSAFSVRFCNCYNTGIALIDITFVIVLIIYVLGTIAIWLKSYVQ